MLRSLELGCTILAFISLFVFPWPFSVLLGMVAAFSFPPAGLALGLLADTLYYPGTGVPYATLCGGAATVIAFFLRKFIKERIL